jgi:serine/threonine protein kinase
MKRAYLRLGRTLARYELIRPIGSGGNGAVYEAFDTALGRRVALKARPMPGGAAAAREKARFLREARAAAHVRHPNVVNVFDLGIEGDVAFLVMELVEGETLAELLKRGGALEVSRALEILLPILSATAELHAAGVVHRDIKPANILLAREAGGPPKLGDFGLSRFVEEASTLTESGVTIGTPEYMAPEVTRGSHEASEYSDQYALGIVLYECTTGAKPFRGATSYELMHAVVHGSVLPPSALEPSLSEAFDRVVLRATHREPRERFESVDELARALVPFSSGAVADRWQSEREALDRASSPKRGATSERSAKIAVNDGVAIALRGDVFTVLWKAPARLNRIQWMYDLADEFASQLPQGIVILCIVSQSSAPPDASTTVACIKRLHKLGLKTRRTATVAVGGGVWKSIVRGVFRAMNVPMLRRAEGATLSGTIEEGIARVLEKKSPMTPSFAEIRRDVSLLYDALDLAAPAIAQADPGRPRATSKTS